MSGEGARKENTEDSRNVQGVPTSADRYYAETKLGGPRQIIPYKFNVRSFRFT